MINNFTYELTISDGRQFDVLTLEERENELIESIEHFRRNDKKISHLKIAISINSIDYERLKEISRSLIEILQTSPYLQELNQISFSIYIGYEAAEDTYHVESEFSEFVIQLLDCIQRPNLVSELALDFDFPFCGYDLEKSILESRTQSLIDVLKKFDHLTRFSIKGYAIYDAFNRLGEWIKNHEALSMVSLGALDNGADASMAYIREILKNLKIQELKILHSFHHVNDDISTFPSQNTGVAIVNWFENIGDALSNGLDQNSMLLTAQEVLDELKTLTQIRNHPSLKTFEFEVEFGELAYIDLKVFSRNCFQTFIALQQAFLENHSLKALNFKFQETSGLSDLPNLSDEDIALIQTCLNELLEKNYNLTEFNLECFGVKIDLKLFEHYLQRNQRYHLTSKEILEDGHLLTGPNPPALNHYSSRQLVIMDRLLLNQTVCLLPFYYDSIPRSHRFFGTSTEDSERFKLREEILKMLVAEFFLLTRNTDYLASLPGTMNSAIVVHILAYLEVQDLVAISRYNGLYKRQYQLDNPNNNQTSSIGTLSAAGS